MLRGDRGAVFAGGLVVGVGLALLFLVWSFPGFRYPAYQQGEYSNAQNYKTGEDNPVIRPSFWETYTSPTDTYAQWIMAILSVATISIWAVWLVRSTLEANAAAVAQAQIANRIAKSSADATLRADAYASDAFIEWGKSGDDPTISLVFGNVGVTPATKVRFYSAVAVSDPGGDTMEVGGLRYKDSSNYRRFVTPEAI